MHRLAEAVVPKQVLVAAARASLDGISILRGAVNGQAREELQVVRMSDSDVKPGTVIARGVDRTRASVSSKRGTESSSASASLRAMDIYIDGDDLDATDRQSESTAAPDANDAHSEHNPNLEAGADLASQIPRLVVARAAAEVFQLGWAIREIE